MQNKAEKKEISPETMRAIYEEVKTPFKAGMALAPEPGEMLDSPVVFRHGDAWFMVFIRFDGKGYETHLATSSDLRSWTRLGCIFRRGEKGAWDSSQADGWLALVDTRWDGPNSLNAFDGRYWMMYLGGDDAIRDRVLRDWRPNGCYDNHQRPFDKHNHESGLFGPVVVRYFPSSNTIRKELHECTNLTGDAS